MAAVRAAARPPARGPGPPLLPRPAGAGDRPGSWACGPARSGPPRTAPSGRSASSWRRRDDASRTSSAPRSARRPARSTATRRRSTSAGTARTGIDGNSDRPSGPHAAPALDLLGRPAGRRGRGRGRWSRRPWPWTGGTRRPRATSSPSGAAARSRRTTSPWPHRAAMPTCTRRRHRRAGQRDGDRGGAGPRAAAQAVCQLLRGQRGGRRPHLRAFAEGTTHPALTEQQLRKEYPRGYVPSARFFLLRIDPGGRERASLRALPAGFIPAHATRCAMALSPDGAFLAAEIAPRSRHRPAPHLLRVQSSHRDQPDLELPDSLRPERARRARLRRRQRRRAVLDRRREAARVRRPGPSPQDRRARSGSSTLAAAGSDLAASSRPIAPLRPADHRGDRRGAGRSSPPTAGRP